MATNTTFNKAQHAIWNNQMAGIVKKITKVCSVGDFTDGTSTSGYVDFDSGALPADCFVIGWKAVTTAAGAWDDDTTAVMTVGISGATDKYSGGGAASVAAAGTVGDCGKLATNAPIVWNDSAATPRVTVTGNADFTSFVTAGTCESTVSIYYIELN
jgi:hypothetical protein